MNRHELAHNAAQVVYNGKVSGGIAGGTILTGVADVVGIIEAQAGTIGILAGALLSLVLIVVHVKRNKRESKEHEASLREAELRAKKLQLEIDALEQGADC